MPDPGRGSLLLDLQAIARTSQLTDELPCVRRESYPAAESEAPEHITSDSKLVGIGRVSSIDSARIGTMMIQNVQCLILLRFYGQLNGVQRYESRTVHDVISVPEEDNGFETR